MKSKEQKAVVFREFLERNSFYIDFNGLQYTMVDKENKIINISNTSDEMLQYIMGFEAATIQVQEINRINIERYEQIIKDMSTENTVNG